MNLSFSPEETAADAVGHQVYPFSPPEEPPFASMTVQVRQVYQDGSTVSLARGGKSFHSTVCILGVYLDEDGTVSIQSPLNIFICEDEAGVHAENEELSIFACGQNINEAIDDFLEVLFSTWQGLKDVPESELTADAVELRRHLMTYIKVA
jgi:hypothetical protein